MFKNENENGNFKSNRNMATGSSVLCKNSGDGKGLDVAYYFEKRCNRNHIYDYKNLWGYARDLYQTPGFGDTTDFEAIKKGYFDGTSPYGIIPKGPDLAKWNTPHGREHLSKTPGKKFKEWN